MVVPSQLLKKTRFKIWMRELHMANVVAQRVAFRQQSRGSTKKCVVEEQIHFPQSTVSRDKLLASVPEHRDYNDTHSSGGQKYSNK